MLKDLAGFCFFLGIRAIAPTLRDEVRLDVIKVQHHCKTAKAHLFSVENVDSQRKPTILQEFAAVLIEFAAEQEKKCSFAGTS
ncbi:hypothetical protein PDUR_21445 [Paenibacillus durus]|uniref:Uncharacterized protein n=1 Tax=Paenibacillus durus TaxID=44251 RepID=A0A089HQ93_PAEDU|nr:hypothetical protein PDUR_21445 [Paenibacillus durus]